MGRQRIRKKIRKQHCAYCSYDVDVNINGRLIPHYNGMIRCLGTGFMSHQMHTLVKDIEKELRKGLA